MYIPSVESVVVLRSRIPNDARGKALLDYLCERFRYYPRERWLDELNRGRVQIDGKTADGHERLRGRMELRFEKLHREPAVDGGYRVLHADETWLAVDKPAHLPMHADGPFMRHTLVHMLRTQFDDELQLVHRLDRETSGVCIAARSKAVQAALQPQFSGATESKGERHPVAERVGKTYLAVVHGELGRDQLCDRPIGHAAAGTVRLRRSAADDAIEPKPACTRFEVVTQANNRTLVRCLPETGRTHQIRVHLEQLGHPIVGDRLYGRADADYLAFVHRMKAGEDVFEDRTDGFHRHLLHAHQLRLRHPTTNQQVTFEAPVPDDFRRAMQPDDS
ncbi:MAG: RluA family pseudouridine synthase [Planctomycetota bacterium]